MCRNQPISQSTTQNCFACLISPPDRCGGRNDDHKKKKKSNLSEENGGSSVAERVQRAYGVHRIRQRLFDQRLTKTDERCLALQSILSKTQVMNVKVGRFAALLERMSQCGLQSQYHRACCRIWRPENSLCLSLSFPVSVSRSLTLFPSLAGSISPEPRPWCVIDQWIDLSIVAHQLILYLSLSVADSVLSQRFLRCPLVCVLVPALLPCFLWASSLLYRPSSLFSLLLFPYFMPCFPSCRCMPQQIDTSLP